MKIKIGNYPTYRFYHRWLGRFAPKQKVSVKIDPWDTWSMDHTLACIVLPMLKQFKEIKQSSHQVDLKDVPESLHQSDNELEDDGVHEQWDYIIDEMIWAFEQKCRDDWESDYYKYEDDTSKPFVYKLVWKDEKGKKAHQDRMTNGFRLFGKYYEGLWD